MEASIQHIRAAQTIVPQHRKRGYIEETYSNSKVGTLFGGQGSNLKLQFMAHTKSGRGPL